MKKTLLIAWAATTLVLAAAATATAGDGGLSDARAATAQFQRFDAALAAGYDTEVIDLNGLACIDDIENHTGGMGIHYLNGAYFDPFVNGHFVSGNVDASTPEAVIYEPTGNGRMRLVAVEYIVTKEGWEASHGAGAAPPSLFGQEFELVLAGNRYGLPDFYELHAWIWKNNPLGMHNDWNPDVTCANA
ncbi:MAG TPA: hypothetical protein VFU56_04430 [Gaiellaceae bacterium]|nr:hypothetical protein [Gaiellaceae bacterium]